MTSVFFLRLCMAVSLGVWIAQGLRVNKDFKDTDGDGWNEFVDAWGNPLSFILWPVGLQKPDGDNFFNATSSDYCSNVRYASLFFQRVLTVSMGSKGWDDEFTGNSAIFHVGRIVETNYSKSDRMHNGRFTEQHSS